MDEVMPPGVIPGTGELPGTVCPGSSDWPPDSDRQSACSWKPGSHRF